MKQYTRKSDNYAGKIEYYQAKLAMAVDALEIHNIKFYTTKLEYFVNRQKAVTGMSNLRSQLS